jgi:hypothetical protein
MSAAVARIENAEVVTSLFGYWPSFHDAEVLDLAMHRGGEGQSRVSLVARVHVFEMTNQVKPDGYFLCHKHLILTLAFDDANEVVIEGFNHQNTLSELRIEEIEPKGRLAVAFEGAYGLEASLTCSAIRVVSAVPGVPSGSIYSSQEVSR